MANTKAARVTRQPSQARKAQPAKDVVVTLRIDPDTLTQLNFIAEGMDRSRANVCAIALREFVEREYPFYQAVAEGLEDAGAGRVVPHDKVSDWIRGMEEGRVTEPPLSGR